MTPTEALLIEVRKLVENGKEKHKKDKDLQTAGQSILNGVRHLYLKEKLNQEKSGRS